jgi:HAD superfamily hydrolase (TIGR01509 family)
VSAVAVLLCDADDCLFPSERPAFEASTQVTNEFLAAIGSALRFEPDELREWAAGKNFRAIASDLAGHVELDGWVEEEKRRVTAHLAEVLRPDPEVIEPLTELSGRFRLAAVSSSALSRLDACFRATELDDLFPPAARFSAEDSLPVPTSKPDPAVYTLAGERLGIAPEQGLAIEDSVSGARSAVAAGFRTIGNVLFVPAHERFERARALEGAGVAGIIASWRELAGLKSP